MTEFTKKYLTKYYIYGYCCIAGFGLQAFFYFMNHLFMPHPFNIIMFILLDVGSILLVKKLIVITSLTGKKKRFYELGKAMLERNEYKERFFLNGMYDPCFQIIAKDLLYSYGRKTDYDHLKTIKKTSGTRIIDGDSAQIF